LLITHCSVSSGTALSICFTTHCLGYVTLFDAGEKPVSASFLYPAEAKSADAFLPNAAAV
jgi:hypothetical protein